MQARYTPFLAPNGKWVIFDWKLYGYCTLPSGDDGVTLLPLEWWHRASADAWLQRCYLTWAKWDRDGGGTPPKDWKPRPERVSPYDNGLPLPPPGRGR